MAEQNHLSVAAAEVIGDRLVVMSRASRSYEIGFDAYPALARIPVAERSRFKIEADGVFLHWPHAGVSLDLHEIRLALDPSLRAEARTQRLAHDRAFGGAVRALRQQHGLPRASIPGLSARDVRRIESGYVPGAEAIDALARAHGMDPDAHLGQVTEAL